MDLHRAFVRTIELGSFAAAGRDLRLASSTVSRQLDALERKLGTTLVVRTTRQLSLTAHGRLYFDEARQMLAKFDDARHAFAEGEAVDGQLRVSVFESFGRAVVLPVVVSLLREHESLSIEVDFDNEFRATSKGESDLYIRIGRAIDTNLAARPLLENDLRTYAARDYLERRGTPAHPSELADHECVSFTRTRRPEWRYRKGDDEVRVPVLCRLNGRGGTVVLESVVAGLGIAQLPTWLVQTLPTESQRAIVEVLEEWSPVRRRTQIYCLFRQQLRKNRSFRVVMDALLEHVAELF